MVELKKINGVNSVEFKGKVRPLSSLTNEELLELSIQQFNETNGDLDKEDGINCPICRNKGTIAILEEGYEKQVDCECIKRRKTIHRLKLCGINEQLLERYSFKTFETNEPWQEQIKNIAISYCEELIKNNNKYWFYIGAVSGCGKSHICTAIFKNLISRGNVNGYYLSWNESIPKILSMERSSLEENQRKYEKWIKEMQNYDILYIDDFLKLMNSQDNSVSLAFKIIDGRYRNDKVTIISSEFLPQELNGVDTAIFGRIREMCDFGRFLITCGKDTDRNQRLGGK